MRRLVPAVAAVVVLPGVGTASAWNAQATVPTLGAPARHEATTKMGPPFQGPLYRGTGDRTLVLRPNWIGTLRWTHSGSEFRVVFRNLNDTEIKSTGKSGWSEYIGPGRLDIYADGTWTIRVTYREIVPPRPIGGGMVGYRGNGTLLLPYFTTRRNTTLRWWLHSGTFLYLIPHYADGFGVGGAVNSQGRRRGSVFLGKGRHAIFQQSDGRWTIGWKP